MSSWKALAVRRRAALGVGCFGARLTTALFELTFFTAEDAAAAPGAEYGLS